MREILFRGKRVDNGEWVYGFYIRGATRHCIAIGLSSSQKYEVIPETVGEYTGLIANGKEIFEGDILAIKFQPRYVERVSWEGKPDAIAEVIWDFNAFRLSAKNDTDIRYADFCDICFRETEIIGNIYNNPELLDGDEK